MRSKVLQRVLDNTPKDVELFVDWHTDLVVRINELLREKNISRKELAQRMDKRPSEISKWLNGEHNFTLRSLAKLSVELGEPLLAVPPKSTMHTFTEAGYVCKVSTFVVYTKVEAATEGKVWQMAGKTKPFKELINAG